MNKYEKYNESCTVLRIDNKECLYHGKVYVEENYRVFLDILDIDQEMFLYIRGECGRVLCLQTNNYFITAKDYCFREGSVKHITENSEETKFQVTIEIFNTCWGDTWCAENEDDFIFDRVSCYITDGVELVGLTPYEKYDFLDLYKRDLDMEIKGEYKKVETKLGISFIACPEIVRNHTDLCFGIKSEIQLEFDKMLDIETIRKRLENLILFFEILSGEMVTTKKVILYQGNKQYDYLGNCNFPKDSLRCFSDPFYSRTFIRKKLFKISDFLNGIDEAIEKMNFFIETKKLALEAYKQILLDEEVGISTTNKFLKIMQMIEGMERNEVAEAAQKEFEEKKLQIIEKLAEQEDKDFVKKYCVNNGDNFIKCLQAISKKALATLSGCSNKKVKQYHALLDNIKNDRDVYTHASFTRNPVLSIEEMDCITYCYKTFFRIRVLLELGISEALIKKRLLHDRLFVDSYQKVFELQINVENYNTGEYDSIMS